MYKVIVPIINSTAQKMGLENHLRELKRLGAQRVLLALDRMFISKEKQECDFKMLKENCKFFKDNGFEVASWIWAFNLAEDNDYIHITNITGEICPSEICPSDERFRKFACDYIKRIAECGVDIIQFDDDFRYGYQEECAFGCTCENHIKYAEELLGEQLTREKLIKHALHGKGNKYRNAWQKSKAHYFKLYANEIRTAVDTVNPNIRISFCSCMSVWDFDGIDTPLMSHILAGKNKPLVRLIGAPYWAVERIFGGCRLQNVIELQRMERSWCDDDIEIMSEGDCYPRPRTNCPANYLEIYDMALRASGEFDGIMKYAIDYHSNVGYENGYIKMHEKNRPLYEKIDVLFGDKTTCGVRVYERMKKYEDMLIPESVEGTDRVVDLFFSPASKMLADNSIPTVYNGDGVCGIAFAENVTAVPTDVMKNGLIIDVRAAEILTEQGIDVGLINIGEKYTAIKEYFDFIDNQYTVNNTVYNMKISESAKVLSHFISYDSSDKENKRSVGSYYYKNSDGQQFLVFGFAAYEQINQSENYCRSYMRSMQIKYATDLFGCEKLPAYAYGNPDLYIIAKKNNDSMSVGLWNIFPDEIDEPVIELDKEYTDIEFVNCTGRLEGNKVFLSELRPFGSSYFEVK